MKRILSNPVYDGKIRWGFTPNKTVMEDGKLKKYRPERHDYLLFDGKHDAIVNHGLFMSVQERLSKNKSFTNDRSLKNPLYGIMYCKRCGRKISRLNVAESRGGHRYACPNKLCDVQSSRYDLVIEAVIDTIQCAIDDFDITFHNCNSSGSDEKIRELRQELTRLSNKEDTLFELLETKVYSTSVFTQRHAELEKKRQEIIGKINTLSLIPPPESCNDKKMRFKDALLALKDESMPPKEKNHLLKKCIERIDYDIEGVRYHSKVKLDVYFKF